MPDPTNSQNTNHDHPSTYVVADRSNEDELTRLTIQDQMLTDATGGVFPEQADPTIFHEVLDVGCGTGGWLIQLAKTHSGITRFVGVDISKRMIDYATRQAETNGVADRVEFHSMDALRMLEFPSASFDLINLRAATGYLRTWDWPRILSEFMRIVRPGGVIRLTEFDIAPEQTTNPAMLELSQILVHALYQAGHLVNTDKRSIASSLSQLMQRHGFQAVQVQDHLLHYHAGTAQSAAFIDDAKLVFRTSLPFLRKWTKVPNNYEELYQQTLIELQQPDFETIGYGCTIWGNAPQQQPEQR